MAEKWILVTGASTKKWSMIVHGHEMLERRLQSDRKYWTMVVKVSIELFERLKMLPFSINMERQHLIYTFSLWLE